MRCQNQRTVLFAEPVCMYFNRQINVSTDTFLLECMVATAMSCSYSPFADVHLTSSVGEKRSDDIFVNPNSKFFLSTSVIVNNHLKILSLSNWCKILRIWKVDREIPWLKRKCHLLMINSSFDHLKFTNLFSGFKG